MKTRKTLFIAILSLAAMSCLLAGCQPTAAPDDGKIPAPKTGAAAKPKIALVMKSLANEFFKTMEDGAKADNEKNKDKYELVSNGIKDEQDVSKQVELVEQMISQKVSAIVIAPADSKALIDVCKKAMDAGIVVVNIDNKFDAEVLKKAGATIPFVGPDNRKGAALVGAELAKVLQKGDKVAILEGAPNAFNGEQRKLGFEDAMKAAGMVVATSQTAYWETDKANKLARDIITSHPDVKALLCANDSMALGAVRAVEDAGKTGKVIVVGFDNIKAAQELLKSDKILATADQHADQLAVFGIEYALEMVAKKGAPADKETPVDLVTKANLKG